MKNPGFTLIELLVVIGILSVILVSGFSLYKVWQNRSSVSDAESIVLSALRESSSMANLGSNDSQWGVKYLSNKLVVFSGSDYVSRNTTQDKFFELPAGVSLLGLDELIFEKFTGLPQSTSSIVINYGEETSQISVSEQGVFSR